MRASDLGFDKLKEHTHKSADTEEPKIVLTRSLKSALWHSAIHILPMAIQIVLIWMNYSRMFIGPNFTMNPGYDVFWLALIQGAAKATELLCIASLATILLHLLRRELLGDGVPIGLLGSGIWFSSFGAFFSSSFLGSVNWARRPISWTRIQFYITLITCGSLAATIGPVTAILMLPRMQHYPAGGASFYMNGSDTDLWPPIMSSSSELDLCKLSNATEYPVCPSAGYASVAATLRNFRYDSFCSSIGQQYAPLCQARGAEGTRQIDHFVVRSPSNMMPSVLNGMRQLHEEGGVSIMQPHMATITWMQELINRWVVATSETNTLSTAQIQWAYDIAARGSATNPVARVRCAPAQTLTADATNAEFPWLLTDTSADINNWASTARSASIEGINRTHSSSLRAQWIHLPTDSFGDTGIGLNTTGLLVELPWTNDTRLAFGCAITASWYNITVRSQRSTAYSAWSTTFGSNMNFKTYFDPILARSGTRPITLDSSWLNLLSAPSSSSSQGHIPTTIESLLSETGILDYLADMRSKPQMVLKDNSCVSSMIDPATSDADLWNDLTCKKGTQTITQAAIAMLVADGLSRFRSHDIFDMQPELHDWTIKIPQTYNSSNIFWTALNGLPQPVSSPVGEWLEVAAIGYAYNPSSVTDTLALVGSCIYLAVTTIFLLCTLPLRKVATSDAWQTVTELLMLCQNSPPPTAFSKLRNTSAGIKHMMTYGTIVKIRAFRSTDGSRTSNVHLVADGDPGSDSSIDSASAGMSDKVHLLNEEHYEMAEAVEHSTCEASTYLTIRSNEAMKIEPDKRYC